MNYFAHALPFLDRPLFLAGTAVPDWLTVCDRQTRLRSHHVEKVVGGADPRAAEIAAGVLQHLRDDARFHDTRAFAETSLALTVRVRDALGADAGLGPLFLGHLLVELLLDAALIADDPAGLAAYSRVLDTVDATEVEAVVNRMAARPARRLAAFIDLFCRERILYDYADDQRLMVRLNQVMRRIGLAPLPDHFAAILPAARELVAERKTALLEGVPTIGAP
jgi:hypothetical protein